jgi:hypothetical protein
VFVTRFDAAIEKAEMVRRLYTVEVVLARPACLALAGFAAVSAVETEVLAVQHLVTGSITEEWCPILEIYTGAIASSHVFAGANAILLRISIGA